MAEPALERDQDMLKVSRTLSIPISEVSWRAVTSGGPGGQHANKNATKVEVWFDVMASGALGPRQRTRLLHQGGAVIRAVASDERSQMRNRQLALERLAHKIAAGLRADKPRVATKPTLGAKERRLKQKHRRAEIKRTRHEAAELD
jgi:ribosome-associated protein